MEHPLAMDAEAMRRAGYATVDALVARLADPGTDPVLRRAGAAEMRSRLGGPPPEQAGAYGAVLARVIDDVLPTDDRWRLSPEAVAAAVRADRRAGRVPFALCASAGSTNTGAVDPLNDLADVCAGRSCGCTSTRPTAASLR